MKASEILHGLAELLAGIEGGQGPEAGSAMAPQAQQQAATLVPAEVDHSAHAEAGTFVPPLQAKIELLKKAVNVDSIYDTTGPDEDLTGHGAVYGRALSKDEIKQNFNALKTRYGL